MNENIFRFLNSYALKSEWFDQVVLFTAEYLGWILLVGMIAFIATHRHNKKEGIKNILVILSSAVLAWIIATLMKINIISPRPFEMLDNVNLIFKHGSLDSFPSGHATFFSALGVTIFFYHKWFGALYIAGALLIGVARVIAGIHFPIDILVGYAIGGVIGWLSYSVYHLVHK